MLTLVSVNEVEVDAPTLANGPALLVARPIEYPVAPLLALHASVTWPLAAVAVKPAGVAGADGVGAGVGDEDASPPPHAANASVLSATRGAPIASFVTHRGSSKTGSLVAIAFSFIGRASLG